MKIIKSNVKGKRYTAVIGDKKISFGSSVGSTYIDHGDEVKRTNYLKRHKVNEDWTKVNAGSLSRFILWGDSPDINVNIANYKKKFGL
jgi:hypothetical protein